MTPGAMTPTTPHGTPGHSTPMLTPGGSTPVGTKAMAMSTPTPGTNLNDINETNILPYTQKTHKILS